MKPWQMILLTIFLAALTYICGFFGIDELVVPL